MVTKASCQRRHARNRALQRFDLELTRKDLDFLVQQIQDNKAKFVERQSHRVSVFKILYKEKDMKVVYDKQRKTIVTFLY